MITLEDVSFRYPGAETAAVSRVSLTIAKGERVSIVGSSGSGKSTLGRLLAGLLRPTSGRIVYSETLAQGSGASEGGEPSGRRVAIVFQNPETQLVGATVEEDVALGPENLGLPSHEIRRRVDWALDIMGIAHLARRPIENLSGGEKQRVAVAGALAMLPRCLVLDEASAMLHPQARRELEAAIARVLADGVAVVQITHDMDEAARADRLVLLEQGEIVAQGPPGAVLSDLALLSRTGLEPPEPLQLAVELRERGIELAGPLFDVSQLADAICKAVAR